MRYLLLIYSEEPTAPPSQEEIDATMAELPGQPGCRLLDLPGLGLQDLDRQPPERPRDD